MATRFGFRATWVAFAVLLFSSGVEAAPSNCTSKCDDSGKLAKTVESMRNVIGALGRQMVLQQMFLEERIRSEADSGLKQVRHTVDGTRPYYSPSHTGRSVASIHDHSNNIRTVGMGEFIAVLNGVEFRTRHNDYSLVMPHKTNTGWHAVQDVEFPQVPPEVKAKNSVPEQIEEMRAWFKAWRDQNHSIRDYRKYFKPVLCYLEGAWTTSTTGEIEEPFESDRHFVDASSWFDLHEKIRFTSYSGRKDNLENFSFLPTTIMNVTEDGYPQFAQWNYRILCHPISKNIPLNRLRVVDEIGVRLANKKTYEQHSKSRSARFQLNPIDSDKWYENFTGARKGFLDEIMAEIPGKDNYKGNLQDKAFNVTAFSKTSKPRQELRADRYHRWFEVDREGAMGVNTRHRGFSDSSVFMAMNTQSKVAGMDLTNCQTQGKKRHCSTINQKWSYAIPLEIIYLTPLSRWNPYNIKYKGPASSKHGKTVESRGRNGGFTAKTAFNGTNSMKFYQTPDEFFSGTEVGADAADTTQGTVGVIDNKGVVRKCSASGTRIFLPEISGVGILRQRYPIMPIHGEGSSVWKELEAIKDLLLKSNTNKYIFREPLKNDGNSTPVQPPKEYKFRTQRSQSQQTTFHTHEVFLTPDQVAQLNSGKKIEVETEKANGHEHKLTLKKSKKESRLFIVKCDGSDEKMRRCWDRHGPVVVREPN